MRAIVSLLLLCVVACSPLPHALSTQGQIIHSEPDRVFVIFRDALASDRYTGGWFYLPGQGIVDKDLYEVKLVLTQKFQFDER